MKNFVDVLQGGDLRSIGEANAIVKEVKNQDDFDELFNGLFHGDRKIVMRAADAVEKITRTRCELLQPHKNDLLKLCYTAEHIELKWHVALLVPRLSLTNVETSRVCQCLKNWARDKTESKIVRVNAVQGVFNLAQKNKDFAHDFEVLSIELLDENVPSLNARIRKLKK